MRCGQSLVDYATRNLDISSRISPNILLKILTLPKEASIEFFNSLTVKDGELTNALARYDHLKPLMSWDFPYGFWEVFLEGI